MIQMEIKETSISKELKFKLDLICKMAKVSYTLSNGSIANFKGTNIAFAKPHVLRVNNNDYLIFEESNIVYINGYDRKIKLTELDEYLKSA